MANYASNSLAKLKVSLQKRASFCLSQSYINKAYLSTNECLCTIERAFNQNHLKIDALFREDAILAF
jgi:hypothetical protein